MIEHDMWPPLISTTSLFAFRTSNGNVRSVTPHRVCSPGDDLTVDESRCFRIRCWQQSVQYKIDCLQDTGPCNESNLDCADIYNDWPLNQGRPYSARCRGRFQATTSQTVLCSQSCVAPVLLKTLQTLGLCNLLSTVVCRCCCYRTSGKNIIRGQLLKQIIVC